MDTASRQRTAYLVLLALLGGTMVCSTWAANLLWVLLGVWWLASGRWREKWALARASRALHAYVAFCGVLLAGMLWTANQAAGWAVLRVSLPLLVVPLVVLTTPPVDGRGRRAVLWFYSGTVTVVSVISAVRLLTIPDLPYREAVPYISHIRFALNCCLVACFCATEAWCWRRSHTALAIASAFVALWMLAFLLLIRSYTAIAVLLVVSLAFTLVYRRRWWSVVLWLAALAALGGGVACEVHRYYALPPDADGPLPALTAGGHPYEHARDGIVENGMYINNYVCREELRRVWPQRSSLGYDSLTASGYGVEPTLIRYLNNVGLTKDSVGVASLTDKQVSDIERGIANPVYEGHNQLRKMVYTMLFERECHRHTGAVAGFTMLQRLELWRATMGVIADHPLLGVGTGDAVDAMHARLEAEGSELSGTSKRTHNQYLTTASMVGLLGLLVVAFFVVRALVGARRRVGRPSPLMLAWILVVLVSFLTEDTLDTLAGILLSSWFLAFRTNKN